MDGMGRGMTGMIAVLSLALSACAQPAAPTAVPASPQPSSATVQGAPATTLAGTTPAATTRSGEAASDPANPFAFTVEVSLSPAAAKRLATAKETIMVAAFYYGVPKPGLPDSVADEMGQVHLGNQDIELQGAGSAVFDGHVVEHKPLAYVQGDPQVNINVFSGRHSSEDNLLDCDFFEDAVRVAHAAPLKINCKLIRE